MGHVVVDGVIDGDVVNGRFPQAKERLGDDGMLNVDDIAGEFRLVAVIRDVTEREGNQRALERQLRLEQEIAIFTLDIVFQVMENACVEAAGNDRGIGKPFRAASESESAWTL